MRATMATQALFQPTLPDSTPQNKSAGQHAGEQLLRRVQLPRGRDDGAQANSWDMEPAWPHALH
jgi:hypothetical protein